MGFCLRPMRHEVDCLASSFWNPKLHFRPFYGFHTLYETIPSAGGQGDAYVVCSLSMLIDPGRKFLGWEGGQHGDSPERTPGLGVVGWAR